jgi:transcriptional regulator with XRE-family HTH domain
MTGVMTQTATVIPALDVGFLSMPDEKRGTDSREALALRLQDFKESSGYSDDALARRMGVSRNTVMNMLDPQARLTMGSRQKLEAFIWSTARESPTVYGLPSLTFAQHMQAIKDELAHRDITRQPLDKADFVALCGLSDRINDYINGWMMQP